MCDNGSGVLLISVCRFSFLSLLVATGKFYELGCELTWFDGKLKLYYNGCGSNSHDCWSANLV